MIKLIGEDFDVETLRLPPNKTAQFHPLWYGNGVTVIHPDKGTLASRVAEIFYQFTQHKVGEGCYVKSATHPLLGIWKDFTASGKPLREYQVEVLKTTHSNTPLEAKMAAAICLSKGDGFQDNEIIVREGWRHQAHEIAVLFPQKISKIGSGGFGVVSKTEGFIVKPLKQEIVNIEIALKNPKGKKAQKLFAQGNRLLEKLWNEGVEGLVPPGLEVKIPNKEGKLVSQWAMPRYTSDFRVWAKKNRDNPQKIVEAFLTVFPGLELLQKNGGIHLDIKPANLLVLEEKNILKVDMNDFDGCFVIPTIEDKEGLEALKKDLQELSLLSTVCICRADEKKDLHVKLLLLKAFFEIEPKNHTWHNLVGTLLNDIKTLLRQIQIYEMGWALFTALTDTPPHNLLPTHSSSGTPDTEGFIPALEKIECTLSSLDPALASILRSTLAPARTDRPSLAAFRDNLSYYLCQIC